MTDRRGPFYSNKSPFPLRPSAHRRRFLYTIFGRENEKKLEGGKFYLERPRPATHIFCGQKSHQNDRIKSTLGQVRGPRPHQSGPKLQKRRCCGFLPQRILFSIFHES